MPMSNALQPAQVHPDTCTGTTLIWNYDEVRRIVQGAGNVVATLSGHTHAVSTTSTNLRQANMCSVPPSSYCGYQAPVYYLSQAEQSRICVEIFPCLCQSCDAVSMRTPNLHRWHAPWTRSCCSQ